MIALGARDVRMARLETATLEIDAELALRCAQAAARPLPPAAAWCSRCSGCQPVTVQRSTSALGDRRLERRTADPAPDSARRRLPVFALCVICIICRFDCDLRRQLS